MNKNTQNNNKKEHLKKGVHPKVFISYSWSSNVYQERIMKWAEELIADGVEVILDKYDLKEGHDKYAFMERMVTDPAVTHVLVFCDKTYSEKANARVAGVGTESQIISKEVYDKVEQSKFIPIFCEVSDCGDPYVPAFFNSRIGIDFSTPEAANENWERLIRLLFGKPLYEKPVLGKPPAYIAANAVVPSSPAISKYNALKQALLDGKPGVSIYRKDFVKACFDYIDSLRVRERPAVDLPGERIVEECGKLKLARNQIVDWVLIEGMVPSSNEFGEELVGLLEQIKCLKFKVEGNPWQDTWGESLSVFVYESFLYVVAALLKSNAVLTLHDVFSSGYLIPNPQGGSGDDLKSFEVFQGYSLALQPALSKEKRYYSPTAELIKRQSDREDITFNSLMEAELLVFLMSCLKGTGRWFPQTLYYASYSQVFPFFIRATQHKHFEKLSKITGLPVAAEYGRIYKEVQEKIGITRYEGMHHINFWALLNLGKLDTIK
jgi:hypothetical protein